MADALSIVAILVSIASFAWSLWTAHKINVQTTSQYAFDAMVAGPVEGKLQQLENICAALSEAAFAHSDANSRSSALQELVRRSFNSWYFSTDALLQSAPTKKTVGLVDLLEGLPDQLLSPINQMSSNLESPVVDGLAVEVIVAGSRFIAAMRAQVHETRLTY